MLHSIEWIFLRVVEEVWACSMSVHWAQSFWTGQCDHFLSCITVGESRWQPMVSFGTFLMRVLTPLWFSRFVAKFSLQCNPFPLVFSLRSSSTSLFLFSPTYLNIASQHWWNRGQRYLHLGRVPQVPSELNPQITICSQISQAICHTELNSFQARTLIHKCTKFQSRMLVLVWILQFLIFLVSKPAIKLLTARNKLWWDYAQDGNEGFL